MDNRSEWVFYLLGAGLTLAWKLIRYCRDGRARGLGIRACLCEWLFEPTAENAFSWATTVGVVWVIGAMYVGGLLSEVGLVNLPVTNSIAFLIGCLAEVAAPNLVKWLLAKLPGGQ